MNGVLSTCVSQFRIQDISVQAVNIKENHSLNVLAAIISWGGGEEYLWKSI